MPRTKKQINYMPFIIVLLIIFALYYIFQNSSFSSFTGEAIYPNNCKETDGGNNPYLRGTTKVTAKQSFKLPAYSNTDFCNDRSTLTEYYCGARNQVFVTGYNCTCSNGACLTTPTQTFT